ncbi:Cysteine-rich PDZ-binding protein (Cysteine-rich interactor of PDZ three) [Psidium guajava]|nr:Cysteine-rich PDZ-binding protein (Cysteine-rich interactor of PDZ three) [Psidium guajava]
MEIADVHIALTEDKLAVPVETSEGCEKAHMAAWEKSNRICLLSMRRSSQEHLLSGLPTDCTAKQMMEALQARYRVSSNAQVGTLIQ